MELYNSTLESGFILVGILTDSGSPGLLCTTISVLYTLALTSNGLLFLVITMDARLHVRMYLLLSQLSLMDLMLKHRSSKASVLRCSAFFMVQLSHSFEEEKFFILMKSNLSNFFLL